MLFENSDMLFPNGTCLLVSLQADKWANIQCTRWPDMLLGMLWYYRTEVQDGHAYCPSVWLLWDTAQTSTFFFLLAILIWSQHLEKKLFRDSLHITVVPLSLPDDVLLGCSSSLLTFCFHGFSSQELQGSLKAFLFVVMEAFLLCTDLAFPVAMLLTSLVHPCHGGRGEVTQVQGNSLPNTREISAVQPSAYAQAGRVAGKQHLKATTGSKMEPWWETKIFRWNKRASSSLDQKSCNYQKLLQRCPSA